MKTPKRLINAMEKQGVSIRIDAFIGDMVAGHDDKTSISLYIRVPFVNIEAVKRLAKAIEEKGLVLDDRNNDSPSISL